MTNPDGTTVQHFYGVDDGLAWESVYDENDHAKVYRQDAFGRLARVKEYDEGLVLYRTRPCTLTTCWAICTEVPDESATSRHGIRPPGPKIGMDDPDMGVGATLTTPWATWLGSSTPKTNS